MFSAKFIISVVLCLSPILLGAWVSIETLHSLTGVNKRMISQVVDLLEGIENEAESGWAKYYHILPSMINRLNLKIGCEIGVSTGGHSHRILETTNVEKLYSIDPYTPNTTLNLWVDSDYYYDIMFHRVKARLGQFGQRSELIRAYSADVVDRFKDNEFDFVFVDGSHEYVYVKEDLTLYYNKIRPGGIMAGDDYDTGFPGVPRAVHEFFEAKDIDVHIDAEQSRIWWVQKPLG